MNPRTRRGTMAAASLAIVLSSALLAQSCQTLALEPEPPRPGTLAAGDFGYARSLTDWLARKAMAEFSIRSMAIAVVRGREILFSGCYGERLGAPASADSPYRLGSITKTFTAMAAMRLAEEGRLDLEAPVARYLPEFMLASVRPGSREIRIEDLLRHRAGIERDYEYGFAGARTALDGIPALLSGEHPVAAPGEDFRYSNIGYALLGLVIERVSGRSFRDYVEEAVLAPLGMSSSSLSQEGAFLDSLGTSYAAGGRPASASPIRDAPAGAMVSTLADMEKFLSFLGSPKPAGPGSPISDASFAAMARAEPLPGRSYELDRSYGYGLYLDLYGYEDSGPVLSHGGNIEDYACEFACSPSTGIGIAILSDSAGGSEARNMIASRSLTEFIGADRGSRPVPRGPEEYSSGEEADLGDFLGAYRYGYVGEEARLDEEGGAFALSLEGAAYSPRRFAPGVYAMESGGGTAFYAAFRKAAGGARMLTLIRRVGDCCMGMPVERLEAAPLPAALEPWLGRWRFVPGDGMINSLPPDYALRYEGGLLSLDGGGGLSFPLAVGGATGARCVLDGSALSLDGTLRLGSLRFERP